MAGQEIPRVPSIPRPVPTGLGVSFLQPKATETSVLTPRVCPTDIAAPRAGSPVEMYSWSDKAPTETHRTRERPGSHGLRQPCNVVTRCRKLRCCPGAGGTWTDLVLSVVGVPTLSRAPGSGSCFRNLQDTWAAGLRI